MSEDKDLVLMLHLPAGPPCTSSLKKKDWSGSLVLNQGKIR